MEFSLIMRRRRRRRRPVTSTARWVWVLGGVILDRNRIVKWERDKEQRDAVRLCEAEVALALRMARRSDEGQGVMGGGGAR